MVETKYAGLLRSSRKDKTLAYTDNICDPNLNQMQDTLNQLLKQGLQDISNLQSQTKQLKDTVDGISVSGGASIASAVSYDNTTSGLEAMNLQNAIDELVNNLGHYETSEEWIRLYLDAEGHILWGIKADGSIEWPVGIPTPIQKKLNELISSDDTIKQTIAELREYTDQQLATKVDKEDGKSLIDNEVKDCFKIVENEEFIHCIEDAEEHILFAIRRDTGKPYFPLNEMYHVEQNEEFFSLWLDADNHVLLGIRRDGEIIGEIHAVNALKQVITQLQSDLASLLEKLGAIDTHLEELLDVFSFQENTEYMAVETDAEGKILASTNADGSHYIHKAKSETIPEEFSHIEDPEGRTEITTDAVDRILGYRDSEGTRHEHKISAKHLELSDEAAKEVNEAFKSAGIKMENPSDFSKDSHIELPIPRIAAQVRIYAPKLPTTKQDNIEAEIEYYDKDGNYFRKLVILNAQGSSSMLFDVKNMAIDINDGSEIKFGDFPTQDSFHLKKYYIDAFRGRCVVGYWLMEQIYKSRPLGKQYPYEYSFTEANYLNGTGKMDEDYFVGSKCHPDGFPITITLINPKTKEETWLGIYTWNLKKSKEVYHCNKKSTNNIILDGELSKDNLWGGTVNWASFEIRNPKSLITIDGGKYDGDNPKELSSTDKNSAKVKSFIERLASAYQDLEVNMTKDTFEKYFLVPPMIDYTLFSQVVFNWDGFLKNWIWITLDGLHWCPTAYDLDSIFGAYANALSVYPDIEHILGTESALPTKYLQSLYADEIKTRYKELRGSIFTSENICGLLSKWQEMIGYDNYKKEFETYPETPSYRSSNINDGWELVSFVWDNDNYDASNTYHAGDTCVYGHSGFKATKDITGVAPCVLYTKYPAAGGFFDSLSRVKVWLDKRLSFLDNYYK